MYICCKYANFVEITTCVRAQCCEKTFSLNHHNTFVYTNMATATRTYPESQRKYTELQVVYSPSRATTTHPVLQLPNCAVHGICSTGGAFDVVRIHTTMLDKTIIVINLARQLTPTTIQHYKYIVLMETTFTYIIMII